MDQLAMPGGSFISSVAAVEFHTTDHPVVQIYAAMGNFAVVDKKPRRPPLVGLNVAIAAEVAMQYHDRALLAGLRSKVEGLVAETGAAVKEQLGAVGGKQERLTCTGDRVVLHHVALGHGDTLSTFVDVDAVGGLLGGNLADPTVGGVGHEEAVELRIAQRNTAARRHDAQPLDAYMRELAGHDNLAHNGMAAFKERCVVGVHQRRIEREDVAIDSFDGAADVGLSGVFGAVDDIAESALPGISALTRMF